MLRLVSGAVFDLSLLINVGFPTQNDLEKRISKDNSTIQPRRKCKLNYPHTYILLRVGKSATQQTKIRPSNLQATLKATKSSQRRQRYHKQQTNLFQKLSQSFQNAGDCSSKENKVKRNGVRILFKLLLISRRLFNLKVEGARAMHVDLLVFIASMHYRRQSLRFN